MCCIDKKVDANDRDAMVKVWVDVMECPTLRQILFLQNGKMNAPLFIYNTGVFYMENDGPMHQFLLENPGKGAQYTAKPWPWVDLGTAEVPSGRGKKRRINQNRYALPPHFKPREDVLLTKEQVAKCSGTQQRVGVRSSRDQEYKSADSDCNCCTKDKDSKRVCHKVYPRGRRRHVSLVYGPHPKVRSNGLRQLDAAIVRLKARKETSCRLLQVYIRLMLNT